MKHAICAALVAAFLFAAGPLLAQSTPSKAKTSKKTKTMAKMTHKSSKPSMSGSMMNQNSDMEDAETSGTNPVHSENPGDPLYLNHPYFNGEARWTAADSLYKHGDFPWALVSKNPDNFRFNADSGQWEILQTPSLGKTNPTR